MSLFDGIIKIVKTASTPLVDLHDATKTAPVSMGCYKLYCNGLKYVGKAEEGLRRSLRCCYNGGVPQMNAARKIYENRNNIKVCWVVCNTREQVRALEERWLRELNLEWNM